MSLAAALCVGSPVFDASKAFAGEPEMGTAQSCAVDGGKHSICGVSKPEDMVPLTGSEWVIVSGYSPDSLYRVSSRRRTVTNLAERTRIRWNRQDYADCPGPLKPGGLTAHGIAIVEGRSPRLLVINHGGREAIEVYGMRKRDAALTWIGCVPIPSDMMANSIVPLPSGGFAVTNLGNPKANVLDDIIAGRPTGDVRLWSLREGWKILPNSQGSGPNGLALSRDGRSIYVVMSGSRDIVRMRLDGGAAASRSAPMQILPDNLRWTPGGTLVTTGMRFDPEANLRCFKTPNCRPPFDIYEVDPGSLSVSSLAGRFSPRPMTLPTTALRVGNELWISSIGGDRIAIFGLGGG